MKKIQDMNSILLKIIVMMFLMMIIIIKNDNFIPDNNKKEEKVFEVYDETAEKIPVLTFHRITSDKIKKEIFKDNEWVESIEVFKDQIKYLNDNNYKTISLDEFYCWYKKECELPKKSVLLTFDDGDLSTYEYGYKTLKKYNMKGVAFIVGTRTFNSKTEKFDDSTRQFISKEIVKESRKEYPNFEYQSHSYDFHDSQNKDKIFKMTKEEIENDFNNNKELNFKYIAYPFGNYSKELIEVLKENNYLLGFTFRNYDYATRKSNQYEIPRIKINGESTVKTIENILNY